MSAKNLRTRRSALHLAMVSALAASLVFAVSYAAPEAEAQSAGQAVALAARTVDPAAMVRILNKGLGDGDDGPGLSNADPAGGISYGPSTLNYYGGRVLHTYETYAVFWDPQHTFDNGYMSSITQFLQDVAHDSGSTNSPYSVLTQYGDLDGPIQNQSTYAGSIVDTDPYPTSGCAVQPICLSDAQLQTELDTLLTAQGVARPANRIFYLLTPPSVQSCIDSGSVSCSSTVFCAYHSGFASSAGTTLYVNIPDEAGVRGCDAQERPNGSSADAVLSALSHETRESEDDPDIWSATSASASELAWYNPIYGESSDACYLSFSNPQGPAGAQYTSTINARHYFIQDEWSNIAYAQTGSGCVGSGSDTGPSPRFSVSLAGATASVDATSSSDPDAGDSIARYVWDFGDGAVGTGAHAQHVYASAGNHTIRLTVADQEGAFMWLEHTVVTPSPCTLPHTVLGTAHADHLVGTPGDDIICGLGGNDTIDGRGGNDILIGGDGNDVLIGGNGNDQLLGGNGNDQLLGGSGNDILSGGDGTDTFDSGAGNDFVDATDRTDAIVDSGDTTAETVLCGSGSDDLRFDPYDELRCSSPRSLYCAPVSGAPAIPAVAVSGAVSCSISDAVVRGGVTVRDGGVANLDDDSITGDVSASGGDIEMTCGHVGGDVTINYEIQNRYSELDGTECDNRFSVGGSVTISNARTGPLVLDVSIAGSVQLSHLGVGGGGNDYTGFELNTVRGSVTVSDDGPADTFIAGNTIRGNLVCKRDQPSPSNVAADVDGAVARNAVYGQRSGQACAELGF